jgi:hypothetical protein
MAGLGMVEKGQTAEPVVAVLQINTLSTRAWPSQVEEIG